MASRLLVVNEWLLDDLLGNNGPHKRKESFEWLERLHSCCDRIVVLEPSPWMQKAYLLMKQNSTESRMISKYLHGTILRNQLKCRLFSPTEIRQAPDAVRAVTPSSDQYLVDLYFTASASKLITTDTVLLEKLPVTKNVEVEHRDSFIKDYPNGPTTQVCP